MFYLKENRKKYYFVIFLLLVAVVVGLLNSLPYILIGRQVESFYGKDVYLPIRVGAVGYDIIGYMARAIAVTRGDFCPSDLVVPQYKDITCINQIIPAWLMGLIYLFFNDVISSYIFALFLFHALIFLSFFYLFQKLFNNSIWSFFFSTVAALNPVVLKIPAGLFSLDGLIRGFLNGFVPYVRTPIFSVFGRFDYPLIVLPFFVFAFGVWLYFWLNPNRKSAIIAGIATGLMIHTYLLCGLFFLGANLILFLYNCRLNYKKELSRIGSYFVYFLIFSAAISTYFINKLIFDYTVPSRDYVDRVGVELGHNFRLFSVWQHYVFYLLLALLNYFFIYKKNKKLAMIYFAILLSMFGDWNIQVITGFFPHPDHWPRVFSPILFVICCSIFYYFVNFLIEKFNKKDLSRFVCLGLIVLSLFTFTKRIINIGHYANLNKTELERFTMDKDIFGSFNFIDRNLPPDSIIASPSFFSSDNFIYLTKAKPYLIGGNWSVAPNKEIEKRLFEICRVFNIKSDALKELLNPIPDDAFAVYLFANYYRDRSFDSSLRVAKTEMPLDRLMGDYNNILSVDLSQWPVDYVYYGPFEKQIAPDANFEKNEKLDLIYQNDKVKIFKIQKGVK